MSEEIPRPKTLSQETTSIEPAESQEHKERIKNLLEAKSQLLTMKMGLSAHGTAGMTTLSNLEHRLNRAGRTDLVSRIISEALPAATIFNVQLAIEALGVENNPSEIEFDSYENIMGHEVVKTTHLLSESVHPKFYGAVIKLLTDYSFLRENFRRIETYSIYKQTGDAERFREAEQRVKEERDFNEGSRHLSYSDQQEQVRAREEERFKRMRAPENIAATREALSAFIETMRGEKEFSLNIVGILQEIEQEIDKELAAG